MNLSAWSFATVAVVHAALAAGVVAQRHARRSPAPTPLAFLGALIATVLWGAGGWAEEVSGQAWLKPLVWGADWLRYAMWYAFIGSMALPRVDARVEHRAVRAVGVAVLAASLLVWIFSWFPAGLVGSRTAMLAWLALPIFGLVLVEQLLRNVSEDYRWHAKPLCLALGSVFVFDIYVYSNGVLFGYLDADVFQIRALAHVPAVPLLFIAARRQVDGRGGLTVSRDAAFHTAALLIVGTYLMLVAAAGYYVRRFGDDWGRALQVGLTAGALLFLTTLVVSKTFRSRVSVFIAKHFFSYHYDYRAEWLRFTSMLSSRASHGELGVMIVRGLADMLESKAGAIWTRDLHSEAFMQSARWNAPKSTGREAVGSDFCRFLLQRGWVVDVDEYRRAPQLYGTLVLPEWLHDDPRNWLVVPLALDDELVGFVVLARSSGIVGVNWEVRDLLKTASRQAAGFLARVQAAEALLEARKFEAFNRMSAFVVHDLKNIVTQLSLMLSNAKRLQDNPEFRADMFETIESSLEKMRQLILQLREGESKPGQLAGVNLAAVAQGLQAQWETQGRRLEVVVTTNVSTRGDDQRMARVLGHLVQNAFDATPEDGEVSLTLGRAGGRAEVVVMDSGRGMSEEFMQSQLFKPFTSTKAGGMGIGAYESAQYIRELGGQIAVDSEPGRGTRITVLLPTIETEETAVHHELTGAK
jgi:putative PEP-CTERM system histidine kinase